MATPANEELRVIMNEHGLSPKQVAELLGMTVEVFTTGPDTRDQWLPQNAGSNAQNAEAAAAAGLNNTPQTRGFLCLTNLSTL